MRLILENAFTWDGIYGLLDESGKKRFAIEANITDGGRRIDIISMDGKIVGSVRQKRFPLRREYNLYARDLKMGEIERQVSLSSQKYTISFKGWLVSGNVLDWDFRIVSTQDDIAMSSLEGGRLALDIFDERNAIFGAILLMGIAGLAYDLQDTKTEEDPKQIKDEKDDPDYMPENANNLTSFKEAAETTQEIIKGAVKIGKKTVEASKKTYEAGEKAVELGKKFVDTVNEKVEDFLEDSPPPSKHEDGDDADA